MGEERMKILKMVAAGKITPEEAARLLEALKEGKPSDKERFFKVRVYKKAEPDKPSVKVDIPVGVLKIAAKLGGVAKEFIPEAKVNLKDKKINIAEITPEMIDRILGEIGEAGRFTLVKVDEEDESVEVFIE